MPNKFNDKCEPFKSPGNDRQLPALFQHDLEIVGPQLQRLFKSSRALAVLHTDKVGGSGCGVHIRDCRLFTV